MYYSLNAFVTVSEPFSESVPAAVSSNINITPQSLKCKGSTDDTFCTIIDLYERVIREDRCNAILRRQI